MPWPTSSPRGIGEATFRGESSIWGLALHTNSSKGGVVRSLGGKTFPSAPTESRFFLGKLSLINFSFSGELQGGPATSWEEQSSRGSAKLTGVESGNTRIPIWISQPGSPVVPHCSAHLIGCVDTLGPDCTVQMDELVDAQAVPLYCCFKI